MKKALLSALAVSSVLVGANAALSATQTIDDFTQPYNPDLIFTDDGFNPTPTVLTQNQGSLPTSSVIGGTRNTVLEVLDPRDPSVALFDETTLASNGNLDQSVLGDGNLTTTTLTWNGGGAGLNANLSAFDRFRLTVNSASNSFGSPTNLGTITLRARNNLGNSFSESSQTLNAIGSATNFDFLFSSFAPGLFSNPISDIQLEVAGLEQGLSFNFASLEAFSDPPPPPGTPEPSLTLGCLLLGGTQFAITGWKRYKNSRKN